MELCVLHGQLPIVTYVCGYCSYVGATKAELQHIDDDDDDEDEKEAAAAAAASGDEDHQRLPQMSLSSFCS